MQISELTNSPTVYMMIGVSGSGKSTWINKQNFDWNNTVLVSTDAIIDRTAKKLGKTYSDVFSTTIKSAAQEMNQQLEQAIKNNMNIVWDQTNLTAKARQSKLAKIPKNYRKVAVFFEVPDEQELERRLQSRPGKNIPASVVASMRQQLEMPTAREGFDKIIVVPAK